MLGVCMALIDDEKDKKAFEKLYNKYKNKVHAISLNILKNEQLAEESTSDTFLSLAKCFQKIKHLEYHKLDYYIVITSRNMAKNISKKEKENLMTVSYDDDSYFVNENMSCYKSPFSSNIFNLFLAYCRRFLAVADVMPSVFEISEYSSPHENFK